MYKGIDIRYATRPTADDDALFSLRQDLRKEEQRHQDLHSKLTFLGERLQAALDAGRADNAMEAATLFARLKEDLSLRFQTIVALNREISTIDPAAERTIPAQVARDPKEDDALMTRVIARINAITTPHALPC